MDIEALNKLQRDMVEIARQTNDETAWQNAQSLEHDINTLKGQLQALGALEGIAVGVMRLVEEGSDSNPAIFALRQYLAALRNMLPSYYQELERRSGYGRNGTADILPRSKLTGQSG